MAKIMLDKLREIRLDLNAMEKFEELTGLKFFKMKDLTELSMKELKALLYTALMADDPEITLEKVGKLIAMDNAATVLEALTKEWKVEKVENPLAHTGP